MRRPLCLAAVLLLSPWVVLAQAPVHQLSRPDATLPEPFTVVRGARELPGERLLIADWIEQRIVIADFRSGTLTDRG